MGLRPKKGPKTVYIELSVPELQRMFSLSIQAIEEDLNTKSIDELSFAQVWHWKVVLEAIERTIKNPQFEKGLFLLKSDSILVTPDELLSRIKPLIFRVSSLQSQLAK